MTDGFSLHIGPGVRSKAKEYFKLCLKQGRKENFNETLFVVPTHRFALELSGRMDFKNSLSWHHAPVFSLAQFLTRLLPPEHRFKRILTQEQSLTLIRYIITREPEVFSAFYSGKNLLFPNLIRSACLLLDEIKKEGISPGNLARIQTGKNNIALVRNLYERYEGFLRKNELLDQADIMKFAFSNLSEHTLDSCFPGLKRIIFDGIDFFPRVLIDFIVRIGKIIPHTRVLMDYEFHRETLFKHMEDSYNRLSSLTKQVHFVEDLLPATSGKIIRERIYTQRQPEPNEYDVSDFLSIFALPDRMREVKFIAKQIKNLIANPETKAPFREICVCFPSFERYDALVREIFEEYGIPCNISLGLSLSRVPVIRAIEGFITLIEENFERGTFIRFLNNPYYSLKERGKEESRDCEGSWLSIIEQLRVSEGISNWIEAAERKKESLVQRLPLVKSGEYRLEKGGTSKQQAIGDIEGEIAELEKFLGMLSRLKTLVAPFYEKNDVSVYSDHIKYCLEELKFCERLFMPVYDSASYPLYQRDIRALEAFYGILENLLYMDQILGNSGGEFSAFARELRFALASAPFYPEEAKHDAVQVLGRLEPRLFSFTYFFLGGFLEGEFPHTPEPRFFISRRERTKLGLVASQETLAADRFLFYHFAGQTRKHLYISYPLHEGDNPLLPSPIIEEINRQFNIEAKKEAAHPNVYSESELQTALGMEFGNKHPEKQGNIEILQGLYEKAENPLCSPERVLTLVNSVKSPAEADVRIPTHHPELKRSYFSTSQLEEYGRCPFYYYAKRLLHLKEPELMEEEMTPLERGNMIHRALFRFYRERANSGNIPVNSREDANQAARRLVELAREEMDSLPYSDLFWEAEKERVLGGEGEARPGLLNLFIEKELDLYGSDADFYTPEFFEVGFGRVPRAAADQDPLSKKKYYIVDHPEGDIFLRGQIDRIELRGNYFAVVDYKTGSRIPGLKELKQGVSLQLAVYLLAARERLEKYFRKALIPAGGIFYQIHSENRIKRDSQIIIKSERKPLLGSNRKRTYCETKQEMEDLLNMALEHVRAHVSGIRKGEFPLSSLKPKDAMCGYCAFRLACRRKSTIRFARY